MRVVMGLAPFFVILGIVRSRLGVVIMRMMMIVLRCQVGMAMPVMVVKVVRVLDLDHHLRTHPMDQGDRKYQKGVKNAAHRLV